MRPLLIAATLLLSGCAPAYRGICAVIGIGQSDGGVPMFAVHCQKE